MPRKPLNLTLATLLVACLSAGLTGCAQLEGALANRITCTTDGSGVLIASMYGPWGIVSKAAKGDAAAIIGKVCATAAPAASAASR